MFMTEYSSIEEVNSTRGVVAQYALTEKVDELVAMLRNSQASCLKQNGLGSFISLTSISGTVAQSYAFGSLGRQKGLAAR